MMGRIVKMAVALVAVAGNAALAQSVSAGSQTIAPAPESTDRPNGPVRRGPAPASPVTYAWASRTWDGTGELLLAPDGPPKPEMRFLIGATFDNSDAVDPKLASDRTALGRCMAATYGARVVEGHLLIESVLGSPAHQTPVMSSREVDGRVVSTFAVDRCRYTLGLDAKVPGEGGWVRASLPPPPPPAVPVGQSIRLKVGESHTIKYPPSPVELSLWTATLRLGPLVPASLAGQCPNASGLIMLEPQGVFVEMPWDERGPVVPGIRRDPEAGVTTLVFQKPGCRLELSVSREIRGDDGWHRSPLTLMPPDVD